MSKDLTDTDLDALETEIEFLQKYDLRKYPAQALTADLCIFTIHNSELSILLIERGGHPEKGKWALPGGFVNVNESVEEAAKRELEEETGLAFKDGYLEQLKTYAYPGRDPRGFIASVAYVALIPRVPNPVAGDDASNARFFPVADVLSEEGFNLAFDHKQIITDALERVRAKLEYSTIAPSFLEDDTFTMSELRKVYEIVWDTELNPSNFRRKIQSTLGFVELLQEKRQTQFDGGRKSDLYRKGPAVEIYPPLRRNL